MKDNGLLIVFGGDQLLQINLTLSLCFSCDKGVINGDKDNRADY